MGGRYAVVLAAGQGTRMKSKLYKVLHPVAGRPMVQHVIDQLQALKLEDIVTIVGFGAEEVRKQLGDKSQFVTQEEQLGTGHAVQQAEELLKDKQGTTIVVCGDTPLLTEETFTRLFEHHEKQQSKATILTAHAPNPTGYGRVIRNEQNEVERIVEQKDATEEELLIHEINTGTYCFDNELLFQALNKVSNDNAQGEYYLPDVVEILRDEGERVTAFLCEDFNETLGVNDRVALAQAETIMKKRLNEKHMRNGVTIIDPMNTYIDASVKIDQDVTIYPGTVLRGETTIAEDAVVGPDVEIVNCSIGKGTTIKQAVALDSEIGDHVAVGPYAHIRPGSKVGHQAKIGHFVELKKTTVGEGSKIPHLSYIGDAEIGNKVNIGCGTITVNYDGQNKHETKIADESFIGSNSNLIAPVTIGKSAYVAAGSTITKDVPEGSLSIARTKQTNREGYAAKIRAQQKNDGGF